MSLRARWKALWCQCVTWTAFLVGFLFLVAVGVFTTSRMVESREIALFAQVCAGFAATGGLIWLAPGTTYAVHMFSALRTSSEE